MPTYSLTAPNGKTYEIDGPAGATPEQVRAEIMRRDPTASTTASPAQPSPPVVPVAAVPAPPTAVQSMRAAIPDPLTVAGNVLGILRAPIKAAFDVAGRADVAAGIKTPAQAASRANTYANIPIPMAIGMLTGGMSLPAQAIAQGGTTAAMQAGGLEPKSPSQIALSAAAPFAGEGISRLIRGLGRTATRVLPGLFQRAQSKAQGELGKVAGGLATEEAGPMFKSVKDAAATKIPAERLTAMLDDLGQELFENPISPGAKLTKEFVDRGRSLVRDGEISLGDLMKFRKELGPMTQRDAPGVSALYKATLGTLEAGSDAGSRLAVQALDASRKTHGSALFSDLVQKATSVRNIGGADAPALDVAKLAKSVNANQKELVKLLGPEGFGRIESFIIQNRSLPPTHAWNAFNKALALGAGGVGALGAGPAALLAGLPELLTNLYQVGGNPAFLRASKMVPLLAGSRAGIGPLAEEAMKANPRR